MARFGNKKISLVTVPVYEKPSGTVEITVNGAHDVSQYTTVVVNVAGGSAPIETYDGSVEVE